jgi:hypothetical protein
MKKRWFTLAGLITVAITMLAAVLIAGCSSTGGGRGSPAIENDQGKGYATIDADRDLFQEGGTGSLTINNQASFDVIIYAGKVSNNNVMGGIRAGKSRAFDLTTLSLPADNGSFLIRAASFEKYKKNSYRVTEADVLYAGLVVYDLKDPRDKTNLNIFAGINEKQSEWIYVSNTSKFVLELRLDTPNGDKLATLGPFQENKQVFLTPLPQGMPYSFYATYVYIDPSTNEIKSFSSKDRTERQRRIPNTESVNPMAFSGPKDTSDIAYQVGFLRLKNSTLESLNFMDGTTWLPDQKGRRLVESGQLATFELAALSGDAGQLYTNLNMEFDSTKTLRISSTVSNGREINGLSVKPGVVYDLVIDSRNGNYVYDVRETAYKDKLEDMRMSLFLGD